MRTFILVALVACAVVLLSEISESEARCKKPALVNTAEAECVEEPNRRQLRKCLRSCRKYYTEEQLTTQQEEVGCLQLREGSTRRTECICLTDGEGEEATTTEATADPVDPIDEEPVDPIDEEPVDPIDEEPVDPIDEEPIDEEPVEP